MKKTLLIIIINLQFFYSFSQEKKNLVVGIVVDQMRYDYVYRFWENFNNSGFKTLVNEGYFFRNTHFSFMPTYTGPGHATIATGTTPSNHGIIANNWFDRYSKENIYCAGDGEMHTICNCDYKFDIISRDGQMSPKHLLTSTIGDQIKLFDDNSKVFGVSLKDRGAILSAGHSADACYWMNKEGEWISSSYYMSELPKWIVDFQTKNSAKSYLAKNWSFDKKFNYNLDSLSNFDGNGIIKSTPHGNSILADLAIELMKQEELGKNESTDFLILSFSSTDYIGHKYGPHSPEIEDTYNKLDNDIAKIISYIEKYIGKENSLIFLTADHGVVSEPSVLASKKIPSGYFSTRNLKSDLAEHIRDRLNLPTKDISDNELILNVSNDQIFLNRDFIMQNLGYEVIEKIRKISVDYLIDYHPAIKKTYHYKQLEENEYLDAPNSLIQKGFNSKRSGDIIYTLEPGWINFSWKKGGTTHGSCFSYDTHVPLLFWGGNIKKGHTDRRTNVKDIAPTIAQILKISHPNGSTGNPLYEITE